MANNDIKFPISDIDRQIRNENIKDYACYKELFEILDRHNEARDKDDKYRIGLAEVLIINTDKNRSTLLLTLYTERENFAHALEYTGWAFDGTEPTDLEKYNARFKLRDILIKRLHSTALYHLINRTDDPESQHYINPQ